MVVVINESLWVHEFKEHSPGEPYGRVLNGGWELTFSNDLQQYWANKYPDRKFKVVSVRKATKGEYSPYY